MIRQIYDFFDENPNLAIFLLPLLAAAILGVLLGFSFGDMAHAMGADGHFWGLVKYTPLVCCGVSFAGSALLWLFSKTLHM